MKQIQHRPLTVAMLLGLGFLVAAPLAFAQTTEPLSMHEQRARRLAAQQQGDAQQQARDDKPAAYPNAMRQQPDARPTPKLMPKLKALQDRYDKQDWAGVMADADAISTNSDAGAYDRAIAFSMAGNAASSLDQKDKAADYFARAVAANGLDNNSHYAVMFNLAVSQFGLDKYAEALVTMDRLLAETKSDKPELLSFRAGILASMGRNDEAATAYQALLAKNPDDKHLLLNAVAALQGAGKDDRANALLADAFGRGMLTQPNELQALYVGYLNAEKFDEAKRVIDAGVAQGILKPGPDLARAYQLLAQNAFYADKMQQAIDLYALAAPMATDGEGYLNLAKTYAFVGRKAEAKEAARQALARGIKKPEDANRILAH